MIRVWAWHCAPERYKKFGHGGDEDWVIVSSPAFENDARLLARSLTTYSYNRHVTFDGCSAEMVVFVTCHA